MALRVLGVFAILVAGGAVVLVFAFPAERVGALAAERASDALDRDVSVESVRLKLLPVPSVALEGVRVERWRNSRARDAGEAPGESRPLAAIRRVEVRPRLLPLLRREVIVSGIMIDEPSVVIEIEDESEPVSERVAERTAGFLDDASFDVRRIRVRGARVEYVDRVNGGVVRLDGIDQDFRLEGVMQAGSLARVLVDGWTDVGSITVDMPATLPVPLTGVPLRVEHDAIVDLEGAAARLERLAVSLGALTLEGAGTIEAWSDPAARRLSVRLAANDADLTGLLELLPDSLRTWPVGGAVEAEWSAIGGRASVVAAIDGRMGDGELPVVDGTLEMDGVAIARGGEPVVEDLTGRVEFGLDRVETEGLTARLLGESLRLAVTVDDTEEMRASGHLSTRLDLARAMSIGLLPEGWTGSGLPGVDLTFEGPLARPIEMEVNGAVTLAGVEIEAPDWPGALSLSGGSIGLADQEVVGRSLAASLGGSDATLDFALADWVPYLLDREDDTRPRLVFESRSRVIEADALFPLDPAKPTYAELFFARLADRPVGGVSAGEAAEEAGYRLPDLPPIVMEGRVLVERLVQRGAEFRDVDVRLAAREGQLEVRGADFQMLGGGIHLTGRLGAATIGEGGARRQPLTVEFAVQDVESDPFLERFTAFRDHVAGTLGVDGTLTTELDANLLPEPSTLVGAGEIAVRGGELVNWSMVRALGDELGIAAFDTIAFEDWTGRFEMVGSRIVLQESALESGDLGVRAAGSFDVSGALDLAGTVYLAAPLTSRLSGTAASTLVAAASDADGRVPVGIRLTGTVREPSVRLDMTEAGSRLAERAREEAEARARELAADAAARIVGDDRAPLLESPAAALDSARRAVGESVGDAVMGRLRGLIGGRGAPAEPDSPPDSTSAGDAGAAEVQEDDTASGPETAADSAATP